MVLKRVLLRWSSAAGVVLAACLMVPASAQDSKGLRREGKGERRKTLDAMEGRPAPALKLGTWISGDPVTLEGLRGKVVVIQFWAAWCGPSLRMIQGLDELARRHEEDGLVVIAIHWRDRFERQAARKQVEGRAFAAVLDGEGDAARKGAVAVEYHADGTPDTYVVDRKGILRFADLANDELARAVRILLREGRGPVEY